MQHFTGKHGVYLIAEIGGNHEGNFEDAKKLTHLAAESGVDAIKFQIYSGDGLVNPLVDPQRNLHFKKFQLKKEEYVQLAGLCQKLNVKFLASVWEIQAIADFAPYLSQYKIGSGDLTAYPIIKGIVQTGKPIILSTGLSNFQEVQNTIQFIASLDQRYIDERKLALLQCSSMYPIPLREANLAVMNVFREKTGLPTGYSDHTVGTEAVEVAIALGAEIIEKHFTDSRENKTFRDHKVSMTKEEIQLLISKIGRIREIIGLPEKKPTSSEIENNHRVSFRRGIFPKTNLKAGHRLREEDLVVLRPCQGIGAEHFFSLPGRKLRRQIEQFSPLSWDDLDD